MAETITTTVNYPKKIDQCVKIGGETYSSWSRLEKVKNDEKLDGTHPYDLCAVAYNISSTRKSGIVYASDFGFNVPDNAEITKVTCIYKICADDITKDNVETTMLKLKVGASTSDTGVGKYPVSNVKWITHRKANQNGMQLETVTNTNQTVEQYWNIKLTGAMVNSSNFGFLIQCGGTGKSKHKVYLDNMRMQLSYTIPEEHSIIPTSVKPTETPIPYHVATSISTSRYDTLTPTNYIEQSTMVQPFDSTEAFNFWLKYRNFAITRSNKKVILNQTSNSFILETDGKTVFTGGSTMKPVYPINVIGTSDTRYFKSTEYPLAPEYLDYFYPVHVYSNLSSFTGTGQYIESTIKLYNADMSSGVLTKKNLIDSITFKLSNNISHFANSKCVLENCTFEQNRGNKGAAINNRGRLYTKDLTFIDNVLSGDNAQCVFYDVDICRDGEYE